MLATEHGGKQTGKQTYPELPQDFAIHVIVLYDEHWRQHQHDLLSSSRLNGQTSLTPQLVADHLLPLGRGLFALLRPTPPRALF
jgi:hypothetical protein